MCVTQSGLVKFEQIPQLLHGEVSLHVPLLIHHTAAQCFLVGLALEDLLLDCSSLS